MRSLQTVAAAAAGLSMVLSTSALAAADTLPGGSDSRTFATSAGGWTSEVSYAGLCVPAITCATVENGYQGSGGADGASDGYLAADFGSLLSAVDGTTTSTWRSPEFVYQGAAGKTPSTVRFDMSIRPAIGALLSAGNSSSYRVDLVDSSGNLISVVPSTSLAASTAWTVVPTRSVNPSALTIGGSYRIQISSSLTSVVGVLATGQIGFDDVVLSTQAASSTTSTGSNGSNGGSSITTVSQLTKITRATVVPGSVKVRKNKVSFKVKCPKSAKPLTCKIKVKGLAKGKKSATATSTKVVKVKAGSAKRVTLKVKKPYVKKYKKAKKISIKAKVKVGKVSTTVVKKVRVRR